MPVGWDAWGEPWSEPSYIPGNPHNLPSRPDLSQPQTTVNNPWASDAVAIRDAYRYASFTDISVAVGTTSFKFLDSPIGKRNFIGLRNASAGAQNIFISFGGAASTTSFMKLAVGQILVLDTVVPQDDLWVISDAAAGVLAYCYSTFAG